MYVLRRWLCLLIGSVIAICVVSPICDMAREPLILTDAQGEYPLGTSMDILEDPQKQWTITDVSSPEFDGRFVPSQVVSPNFGYTNSAYWVRFFVSNEANQGTEWLLELGFPNINRVDVYWPLPECQFAAPMVAAEGCSFQHKQAGNLLPFALRDIRYHRILFKLPLPPQTPVPIYVRFENKAAMTLPLNLWSLETFTPRAITEELSLGLFCGILLIMAGYNLFLAIFLRDRSYGYYVLFILSYLFFQMSFEGIAYQYLWPNFPWLNGFITTSFAGLTIFATAKFVDTFLQLKRSLPKIHFICLIVVWISGILTLLTPFGFVRLVIQLLTIVTLGVAMLIAVAGILRLQRGYRPAFYFLIAWGIFLLMISLQMLTRSGILPSTPLTESGDRLGMVMLVLLLSLALTSRIRTITREKELLQTDALRLKDELNIALQQAKEKLETHVVDQQLQLERANLQIQTLNRVLTSAEQLGNASAGLTHVSMEIVAEAEETSQQVALVSSNSAQIAQSVHNAFVDTEDVATNTQEIVRMVTNVAGIINQAVTIANSANTTMTSLATHSQEIGAISKVITNIAQQTNLLALNATIEAARAGDLGKGFTVVASEVKELARETSKSAEDITHKIQTIQMSSQDATDAITQVVAIIEQVSQFVHRMTTAITEQTHTTGRISETIAAAARGTDEINRAILEISTAANASAQRAANLQNEAQKLSGLSEELRRVVEATKVQ